MALVKGEGDMMGVVIWAVGAATYLLFRLWYDNIRGPLKASEIERFLAASESRHDVTGNSAAILRAFLEADDGREFVMLNLVKAEMGEVADPDGGKPAKGLDLLKRYSRAFTPVLLRNGGHPGIVGRKVGGYIDAWNTEPDPDWTLFGLMRYRSRRDLMKLATDPAFLSGHPLKLAGTAATFSFPTQRVMSFYIGPRISVALIIALIAALTHLAILSIA